MEFDEYEAICYDCNQEYNGDELTVNCCANGGCCKKTVCADGCHRACENCGEKLIVGPYFTYRYRFTCPVCEHITVFEPWWRGITPDKTGAVTEEEMKAADYGVPIRPLAAQWLVPLLMLQEGELEITASETAAAQFARMARALPTDILMYICVRVLTRDNLAGVVTDALIKSELAYWSKN